MLVVLLLCCGCRCRCCLSFWVSGGRLVALLIQGDVKIQFAPRTNPPCCFCTPFSPGGGYPSGRALWRGEDHNVLHLSERPARLDGSEDEKTFGMLFEKFLLSFMVFFGRHLLVLLVVLYSVTTRGGTSA